MIKTEKAEITQLGWIGSDGLPTGFSFNHTRQGQTTPAIQIYPDGRETLYSGYSLAELKALALPCPIVSRWRSLLNRLVLWWRGK